MRAVCIDFETANGFIGSACSVGIAVIEEGQIIDIVCSKEQGASRVAWSTLFSS